MMKSEFIDMLSEFCDAYDMPQKAVTDDEYELIEFIYTFHPLEFDKNSVVGLFVDFGIIIFEDMLPRALKNRDLEIERDTIEFNFRMTVQAHDVKSKEIDEQINKLKEAVGHYEY